jgi:hypothetical protein
MVGCATGNRKVWCIWAIRTVPPVLVRIKPKLIQIAAKRYRRGAHLPDPHTLIAFVVVISTVIVGATNYRVSVPLMKFTASSVLPAPLYFATFG